SSPDSNPWRVLFNWDRATRHRSVVNNNGRPWREFSRNVRASIAVYFVMVVIRFFSWSIKLPLLICQLWQKEKTGFMALRQGYGGQAAASCDGVLVDIYLLAGIAIVFVIFTLVSTKLPHYTLPAFPLLTLLLARHWLQGTAAASRRSVFVRIAIVT